MSGRAGILAGGNWIVDRAKFIDTYPCQDALASILLEAAANGGSPFNLLVDLAKLGARFPLWGVGLIGADADEIALTAATSYGMSIAASELPELSDAAGDSAEASARVRARLETALQRVAFFIVPSAVGFLALGDVIIGLLLRGGRFQAAETVLTWGMLAGSAVGLLAATMGRLYSSTFFAFHDTRTPQRFAIVRVALGSALGAFGALVVPRLLGVGREWGGVGLALAGSVAGWVEYSGLRRRLNARVGHTGIPRGRLWRLLVAALSAALVALAIKLSLPPMSRFLSGPLVLAVYGAFYGVAAFALRIPEAEGIVARLARVVRRR